MDLKAIRAEIEALIKEYEFPNDYVSGHNKAIKDALAIIDSHIEPKDEPTEAGLWQCTKNGANHIIDVAEDLAYPKYCKGGQWTKVQKI